jgi:hypothetical protein
MRFVVILALTACTESTEERLDRLLTQADITCWSHHCEDGPGARYPYPSISTERGVSCMNDALASGESAVALWSIDRFNPWSTSFAYVLTVDHEVRVFTASAEGSDPPENFRESPSCVGPFRIGPGICAAWDPANPGYFVEVNAIAWDGCP